LLIEVIFLLVVFSGCSSAPKKPAEVFTDRNMAVNQLNLANLTANRGHYEQALLIVEDARRLALGTDDPSLRLQTAISRGGFLFSLGRDSEAFEAWKSAAAEGDATGQPALAALARIYAIRAELIRLSNEEKPDNAAAEALKARLGREMPAVRADALSTAAGHVTLGLAEKQLGRWNEAENAVKSALDIHEKGRYLEDAAYDWFLIASIRSVAGSYDSSLEALRAAIAFDRRAENGFGLASSWQATGDVYQKAGRREEALAAWRRSAEIYRALGHNDRAAKLESESETGGS
jgi:tetratricopeptide (TPR) repeat protein